MASLGHNEIKQSNKFKGPSDLNQMYAILETKVSPVYMNSLKVCLDVYIKN